MKLEYILPFMLYMAFLFACSFLVPLLVWRKANKKILCVLLVIPVLFGVYIVQGYFADQSFKLVA